MGLGLAANTPAAVDMGGWFQYWQGQWHPTKRQRSGPPGQRGTGFRLDAEHLQILFDSPIDIGSLGPLHLVQAKVLDVKAGYENSVGQGLLHR